MDHQVEHVAEKVRALLASEGSGHDWEHIRRVWQTALRLGREEGADEALVSLTALLHDVDDRKLTGDASSEELLPTTTALLREADVEPDTAQLISDYIRSIGFSKAITGEQATAKVAMVVADADYLDAMGFVGVARCFTYGGHKGRAIFLPEVTPAEIKGREHYTTLQNPSINHFFEKLLKLKDMMRTDAGKREAAIRDRRMREYLRGFFEEVVAPKEWFDLLHS